MKYQYGELSIDEAEFREGVRKILEDGLSKLKTRGARRGYEYIIARDFTAKETSTEGLMTQVDSYQKSLLWYDKLLLKLRIKETPPRIEAFQEELTDRVAWN
tara:strand:+ start:64 stop:369 length:306 start_codon:yes stop_codon:yes gene_type:complete